MSMNLMQAMEIATSIREKLKPYTSKINIAGSLRRKKPFPKDIEIVCLPTDKHRLVKCEPFLMPTDYTNGPKSIEDPAPVITANRKHHYLVNPSWGGNPGSIEEPCCVVVARQDKAPLYFVQVECGKVSIAIYEDDSDIMKKIKEFMVIFELVDIKMRMLRVHELLKIQGFPDGYHLEGNQSDQKKFIGNSVVPHVVKAWTLALANRIIDDRKTKVA
jgi:DNA (cytosine-5)-methyltransferase 1